MSEIQVWEQILKWGLSQDLELSSDPSNYSKDDFNTLKNTLQSCIPFIRFYNLTSKEFLNKVYPYKKVLPKELCEDLNKCFLDSDHKSIDKSRPREVNKVILANIDSKIISNKHVELISKWIDKVDTSEKSYEFKLLFHGSRDGFTGQKFHEICDNKSHTVSIIKVKDSNEILGGYNPIEWKSVYDLSVDKIFGITKDNFILTRKIIIIF